MGFNIDMSPLERSSMNIGQSLVDIGQTIGGAITRKGQQQVQQQEQGDIEAFMRQAMSGDQAALEELMVKSPQAARMVAEHLQSQQAGQLAENERYDTQIAQDTAGFVEQLHLAPPEQQEAMFNAAVDDPRYDIDEEDRQYFSDPEAQKHIITKAALARMDAGEAKIYLDSLFGGGDKFEQGTGKMSGYSYNPNDGTYSISPDLKAMLDAVKDKDKLEVKDKITLNKEFTNLTKDTKLIRNTAADLAKLSKFTDKDGNISGPSSIAMVFKFMKALDPTSVVRESEFQVAENSSGVPENISNMYNKLWNGGKLGPKQVAEFIATAKQLSNSAIDSSTVEITDYLNTFEDDLSPNFKKSLLNRISKRFDVAEKVIETPVVVDNTNLSDEDLVNKYSVEQ